MNYTASESDDSSLDKCFTEYVKGFHRMGYDVNNINHNHLYHCCVGTYSHNCSIPDGKNVMFNVEFVCVLVDEAFCWFLLSFHNLYIHGAIFVSMLLAINDKYERRWSLFWIYFSLIVSRLCIKDMSIYVLFCTFWYSIILYNISCHSFWFMYECNNSHSVF